MITPLSKATLRLSGEKSRAPSQAMDKAGSGQILEVPMLGADVTKRTVACLHFTVVHRDHDPICVYDLV